MPPVRVGPKHQVTIPQTVREALHLSAGDFLDAAAEGGRIVLTPLHLSAKAPAPRLTGAEQRVLLRVRTKIERIRKDLVSAKGLTREEAAVAAKAGIIEPDQRYWWTEEWQKRRFAADYAALSQQVRQRIDNTLDRLLENPRHPSLQAKKMKGFENRWEARVTTC